MPVRLLAIAAFVVLLPATARTADAPPLVAAAEHQESKALLCNMREGVD
jgi:hypothetical protein